MDSAGCDRSLALRVAELEGHVAAMRLEASLELRRALDDQAATQAGAFAGALALALAASEARLNAKWETRQNEVAAAPAREVQTSSS